MPPTFRDVQPILAHAVEHLDEDSSLAVLAERAEMSLWRFHRTFSAVAGETPKQVIQRLRLGRAAGLLLSTRLTILDIALTCGFQSHEVFCRAFRRLFKLAPLAYRERGLVNAAHVAHARSHADLVNKMGPCIGLYHMITSAHLKENDMPYSITKQELSPQPVLVVRRRVKRSEIAPTIGEALPHIFMYAQQHGIALSGLPFTRYVEMGPGLITMEPGMRIAADPKIGDLPVTAADGVLVDTLPGGLAATTMHVGSYDHLQDAYGALELWIEAEGLVGAGAPWESYLTDPAEHPDCKDWKTEVFWPIREAAAQ